MRKFIEPESVAVIGASANPLKGGNALVANMKEVLGKRVYPVNPLPKPESYIFLFIINAGTDL